MEETNSNITRTDSRKDRKKVVKICDGTVEVVEDLSGNTIARTRT